MEPKRVQDLTLESMVCGRKMWTRCNEASYTVVPSSGCVALGNLLELCCCGSYSFKINKGTSMCPAYFCHWYKIKPYIYWLNGGPLLKFCLKLGHALAGVAQLVGHSPANLNITGLIPGWGTGLGCGNGPQSGRVQEATDWCFSLTSMFLYLYFSLLSPLSEINKRKKSFYFLIVHFIVFFHYNMSLLYPLPPLHTALSPAIYHTVVHVHEF